MKLRDKRGQATFTVEDAKSGQAWLVDPKDYLTRRQVEKMPARPDMILQFSHHLDRRWREKGHADVAVYADVLVSLNGRPAEPLVDREVDLTTQRRSLAPWTWIRPLAEPLTREPVLRLVNQLP